MAREQIDTAKAGSFIKSLLDGGGPAFTFKVISPDQVDDAGRTDRRESLKKNWPIWLNTHRLTAEAMPDPKYGNVSPIVVVGKAAPYKLVSGQRRILAARELKLQVHAKIYAELTEQQRLQMQHWENTRENLTPHEAVMEAVKLKDRGMNAEEIGETMGKGTSTIRLYLKLHESPDLLQRLAKGELSLRDARMAAGGHAALLAEVSSALDLTTDDGSGAAGGKDKKGHAKPGAGESEKAPPKVFRFNVSEAWEKRMVFTLDVDKARKSDIIRASKTLSEMVQALRKIAKEAGYLEDLK